MSNKPDPKTKLNLRQDKFVREYVKTMNGEQSAIAAGYSPKTARVMASQLLTNVNVQRLLMELKSQRDEKLGVDAEWVIKRLMAIADSDVGDLYDESGKLRPMNEVPKEVRKCISGVDVFENFADGTQIGETRKIKLWEKTRALESLAKHLGMYKPDTEVSVNIQLTESQADERLATLLKKAGITNGEK